VWVKHPNFAQITRLTFSLIFHRYICNKIDAHKLRPTRRGGSQIYCPRGSIRRGHDLSKHAAGNNYYPRPDRGAQPTIDTGRRRRRTSAVDLPHARLAPIAIKKPRGNQLFTVHSPVTPAPPPSRWVRRVRDTQQ
jgi:hypothetical protein